MSIRDLQTEQHPIEVQQLKARMQQIETQLIEKTPDLPIALADIHRNLLEHEELVHLMDDNDIQILHKAHEIHKQFVLIQKEIKAQKSASRKGKKLSNEDLANL